MAREYYGLTPKSVPHVETPYRKITTQIPVPETVSEREKLKRHEPRGMQGVPPIGILWDHAEGFQVYDAYGNMWLDWSSGVLVTSAGHCREEIKQAIKDQLDSGLMYTYLFPHRRRIELIDKLLAITPKELDMVLLLSAGGEATDRAFKFARSWGRRTGGDCKIGIVTFQGSFHGRGLGSQIIGGIPKLKEWIVNQDPSIVEVPFPGDFRCEDKSFSLFENTLKEKGISSDQIAGVISETFQGGNAALMPRQYAQDLSAWCKRENVLLVLDEVQAGFGRTGKMFGFEHYGVVPDMITCGKATTSSLPLSAVIGRSEIMDIDDPVSSTHTGNPVTVAAAIANIDLIVHENLAENAARVGVFFKERLDELQAEFPDIIGAVLGQGLVYGVHVVKKGTTEPDGDLAFEIVRRCAEKGLLMFSPVGSGGAVIKICPPLTITREAVQDGMDALWESVMESR